MKNKKVLLVRICVTMFCIGFFAMIFLNIAQAENSLSVPCMCKTSLDSMQNSGIKYLTNESDCDQYCMNKYGVNAVYALGIAGGAYKPVTKTTTAVVSAAHICVCTSGAVYDNAITGTVTVADQSGCIDQCRSSSSKLYKYDTNPWKDVPALGAQATQPQNKKLKYTLLESFPGFFIGGTEMTDLPTMILAIYKFGIWTVGIAGLFMLVVGGFMYMASAGNTSTASSARGIITDSLIGIIAAMGAYLILYVINPDLTKINISFTPVEIKYDNIDASNPNSSTICQDCVSVADICKESPCSLNKTLAEKLRTALSGQNARITEGWPATVNHSSSCHGNGTCADVNLTLNKGNVQEVKNLYEAIRNVGLKPMYEDTPAGCQKYTAAGVYCKSYSTMTSPSFHVNM